ncbi:betaine/proline/choline family ABC transporter ATP-binding protein [Paenibacillus doosanensis]|uniref:Quaternary amine transport ATP-binding protein n=1 Tax=Paenibacillus konkukensis TaxID=2020716 RepID=A0ABY4RK39_9BACL|nr:MULTISPECIES: betaine/proline/choline family ABC transporter ATP-binding protein [Paenibacillus]MCS7460178.1 betaine/proline/choline family ABC transporter ATP-binding protein [Paenibacillus doosanensis]UQZ82836.1 Glycine betaine/carnitine/choline transport ATP-binding protein OpuCA [Paenibacillus konkukensis]
MIRLQGVRKVYDDGFQALKHVDLEFKEGEISVLIGPSGCGKTTTMKLINRLNNPSAGTIEIRGQNITAMDPVELRRQIGYVIQNIGLFPHMSIAKNVGVVPRLLKWDKRKIEERVDELLSLVGMEPDTYRNRFPSELSGGQQQRIGVIRALAADPEIILMDEPFSALDPISREQLQDELIRLQQELRKTIVFVTHDMDEAIKIADTIVLMKDGEVVQTGTPEQILRHPANDFVKSFIGKKRLHSDNDLEALPIVDEVMVEQPATAYPSRGLAEALKMMEKRRVDSLLIVGRDSRLQGAVSIYQVLDKFGEEGMTVADVMKPVQHVVQSGTPLSVALGVMSEHQLSNLAVVRDGNQLVGLLTRGSVVRHMAEVYAPAEKEEPVYDGT